MEKEDKICGATQRGLIEELPDEIESFLSTGRFNSLVQAIYFSLEIFTAIRMVHDGNGQASKRAVSIRSEIFGQER